MKFISQLFSRFEIFSLIIESTCESAECRDSFFANGDHSPICWSCFGQRILPLSYVEFISVF